MDQLALYFLGSETIREAPQCLAVTVERQPKLDAGGSAVLWCRCGRAFVEKKLNWFDSGGLPESAFGQLRIESARAKHGFTADVGFGFAESLCSQVGQRTKIKDRHSSSEP